MVVLQDLLRGVRDRVVVAVTFLAMLELMKRREIVVEQAEPWGPIVARRTTAEERAAVGAPDARRGRAARRIAGVVRVTEIDDGVETATDATDPRRSPGSSPRRSSRRSCSSRRSPSRDARSGCSRASTGRPSTSASAISRCRWRAAGSGCSSSATASSSRPRPRPAPSSPATSARTRSASRPAALETLAIVAYRQPVTRAAIERIRGVDSDYTVRALLHRRLIVEQGRSEAPGRPFLYGTGFEFLERFGLTSLEELPPLDLDVAARLVDEADAAAAPGEPAADAATVADDDDGPG